MTQWIVDSNAFIHLGSIASEDAINCMNRTLSKTNSEIHVTSGVHVEVKTVRFRTWKGRPKVLDVLSPVINTSTIPEDEIRVLSRVIGENAAPQDVDISLMVLAARQHNLGREVILVSDDYKMTTTREKAGFSYPTCPPSTFIQRLSEVASESDSRKLRSLAKRIRAAEMRYAISRAGEYDIQGKLTWLIESLLSSKASRRRPDTEGDGLDESLVIALRRHIDGERIKKSSMKRLGRLPQVCEPIKEIDDHLESLLGEDEDPGSMYDYGLELLQSVYERIGAGLSPLDDELCMIAHRTMAGPVSRFEAVLGLLAGSLGRNQASSLHMARALSQSTLSDDSKAESRTMHHLGLMALASNEQTRAASLFESAARQSSLTNDNKIKHIIAAGISHYLAGDGEASRAMIRSAAGLINEDKGAAIEPLLDLARSLMGIDRPWLALEIFDEALECAIESDNENEVDRIRNLLTLVNVAAVGEEDEERRGLRLVLDELNTIDVSTMEKHEAVNTEIEEAVGEHMLPIGETWMEWRDSSDLINAEDHLRILRVVDSDEGSLAITHHPDLGGLGIWLPGEAPELSSGLSISIRGTRIKLAEASSDLAESQNIRGVIAVEKPEELVVMIVPLGEGPSSLD